MREIYFRVWDKTFNCMYYGNYYWWDSDEHSIKFVVDSPCKNEDGEIDLMEFTGLKDKNGKECYWDDWVTDGINPKFLVTPDYHLLSRLSEIEFEIVGNKYDG